MSRSFAFAGLISRGSESLEEYLGVVRDRFLADDNGWSPHYYILSCNYGPIPEATLDQINSLDDDLVGILCYLIARAAAQHSRIFSFARVSWEREDIIQHLAMDTFRELKRLGNNPLAYQKATFSLLAAVNRDAGNLKKFIRKLDQSGLGDGEQAQKIEITTSDSDDSWGVAEWSDVVSSWMDEGIEPCLVGFELFTEMMYFTSKIKDHRQARALQMYYLEGSSQDSISQEVGASQALVSKWLSHYRPIVALHFGTWEDMSCHALSMHSIKKSINSSKGSWEDLTSVAQKEYALECTSEPFYPDIDHSSLLANNLCWASMSSKTKRVRLMCMFGGEHGQQEEYSYIRRPEQSPYSSTTSNTIKDWCQPLLKKNEENRRVAEAMRSRYVCHGSYHVNDRYNKMWSS